MRRGGAGGSQCDGLVNSAIGPHLFRGPPGYFRGQGAGRHTATCSWKRWAYLPCQSSERHQLLLECSPVWVPGSRTHLARRTMFCQVPAIQICHRTIGHPSWEAPKDPPEQGFHPGCKIESPGTFGKIPVLRPYHRAVQREYLSVGLCHGRFIRLLNDSDERSGVRVTLLVQSLFFFLRMKWLKPSYTTPSLRNAPTLHSSSTKSEKGDVVTKISCLKYD